MKIDRSAFLVLTAALSTAGCEIIVEHPQPKAPTPPPAAAHNNTPPPAKPGNVVLKPGAPPTPAPAAPSNKAPVIVLHGVHVNPPTPPTPTPTPTPPGPGPSMCLDTGNFTVPACAPSCTTNPFMAQRCATYAADFDSKVAQSAVACINGLTGAKACDSQAAYDCGKSALMQACPDNTVAPLCQIAATPCKVAAGDCVTMLSGLDAAGQDAIAQCVAKGCSAGLYSCIEGLTSSTEGTRK